MWSLNKHGQSHAHHTLHDKHRIHAHITLHAIGSVDISNMPSHELTISMFLLRLLCVGCCSIESTDTRATQANSITYMWYEHADCAAT